MQMCTPTHPHTRVYMVYIYFCIGLCWEPWVAPIPTRPFLYHRVSAVSFYTSNFLTTSWLQPAVSIFAYGIGHCSNKSPVASTVPFPVGMSFLLPLVPTVPISYFCLPAKLWYPMPGQPPPAIAPRLSCTPWDETLHQHIPTLSLTGLLSCHSVRVTGSSS